MNEFFQCEVLIKSKWFETDRTIEIKSYDPNIHWNPKLYIQNVLNDCKETVNYKVKSSENGVLITEYKTIKAKFWERIELYDVCLESFIHLLILI
jgi:hypothetical protein